MARIAPLLWGLVKIRWRTLLGRGSSEITGEVLLLLASALMAERVLKYLPELPAAGVWTGLALAWLGLGWGPEGMPGQFPLGRVDRLVIRLVQVAVNPLSWVVSYLTVRVSPWAVLLLPLALVEWPEGRRGKRLSAGPSRWPGLLRKDVRAAVRLFDTAVTVVVVLMFGMYAVREPVMAPEAAWLVTVVVALGNSTIALNAFGTDNGTGFDRYLLLPLSGAQILGSKTVSLLVLVGGQLGLIALLVGWRLGWAMGLVVGVEGLTLLAILAGFGAWVSVRVPFPLRAYRFSEGGSVWAGLVLFALCLGPGFAAARGEWWVRLLMLGVAGGFAWMMVGAAGRRLLGDRERIRARLP